MIRHICMFQLKKEANGKSKARNLEEALRRLDEMKTIDLIKRFEVVTNYEQAPENNYDLSLIFDFDTMQDLVAYQKHPMHVEFRDFITPVRENRACIDFEISQ